MRGTGPSYRRARRGHERASAVAVAGLLGRDPELVHPDDVATVLTLMCDRRQQLDEPRSDKSRPGPANNDATPDLKTLSAPSWQRGEPLPPHVGGLVPGEVTQRGAQCGSERFWVARLWDVSAGHLGHGHA